VTSPYEVRQPESDGFLPLTTNKRTVFQRFQKVLDLCARIFHPLRVAPAIL
jgi:hypothetical protein